MHIQPIEQGPKREELLPLLLEADPSTQMIELYLQHGLMLTAVEGTETVGALAAIPLLSGGWEVKNLAVSAPWRGIGVGRMLLHALEEQLPQGTPLWVGTSESGVPYYIKQGYHFTYTLKNFFTAHYPEPILENGVPCVDMLYLSKKVEREEAAAG